MIIDPVVAVLAQTHSVTQLHKTERWLRGSAIDILINRMRNSHSLNVICCVRARQVRENIYLAAILPCLLPVAMRCLYFFSLVLGVSNMADRAAPLRNETVRKLH